MWPNSTRLHHAGDDLALAVLEFLILAVALGIAHLLEDDLLCRLCGDPAEFDGGQRIDDEVADLGDVRLALPSRPARLICLK
jgi:hypothetical protein